MRILQIGFVVAFGLDFSVVLELSGKHFNGKITNDKPFKFLFLGMMTQLGTWHGVLQGPDLGSHGGPKLKGIVAWFLWRSAYWGYQVSITNKILIPMYWFKSYWFGRDISKF